MPKGSHLVLPWVDNVHECQLKEAGMESIWKARVLYSKSCVRESYVLIQPGTEEEVGDHCTCEITQERKVDFQLHCSQKLESQANQIFWKEYFFFSACTQILKDTEGRYCKLDGEVQRKSKS